MAAGASTPTTTTTSRFKIQSQPIATTTNPVKPKRRKCREITISANHPPSPSYDHHQDLYSPSPSPSPSLRCISSNTSHSSSSSSSSTTTTTTNRPVSLQQQSPLPLPLPLPMEFSYSPSHTHATYDSLPSSFTKFNSALTAGLLNPMSPPPIPIDNKHRSGSSPTLFDMMMTTSDSGTSTDSLTRIQPSSAPTAGPDPSHHQNGPVPLQSSSSRTHHLDRHLLMQQRISHLLSGSRNPGNLFNDPASSDIRLTLSDKDGFSLSLSVHRHVLVANSTFFAGRLSDRWTKPQTNSGGPFEVEIADCDDVEVYVETLRLIYCNKDDLRRMLIMEDVPKVLGILKISAAIGFDAGILSCLEYLEAAPWAEDEEEKVVLLLSELRLEGTVGASEVLKRIVSQDNTFPTMEQRPQEQTGNISNEQVLMKLLQVVLEGKDEKARREMKGLVSKMLRENPNHNDLRKDSLYSACQGCLHRLQHLFFQAAESYLTDACQIAREADNLHWILDILIDRQISEEFLDTWANQIEMSTAHPKVPPVHRFEVSRVTARLFVGIGKGQLLASKDSRCLLVKTWLGPFYDDFGWMKRASNGLDRHLIEDGLSNTVLTLPMSCQQDILLAWFDRFLNSGEDCPNIQRGFEVWWRRAFWRRTDVETDQSRVRIANAENSS